MYVALICRVQPFCAPKLYIVCSWKLNFSCFSVRAFHMTCTWYILLPLCVHSATHFVNWSLFFLCLIQHAFQAALRAAFRSCTTSHTEHTINCQNALNENSDAFQVFDVRIAGHWWLVGKPCVSHWLQSVPGFFSHFTTDVESFEMLKVEEHNRNVVLLAVQASLACRQANYCLCSPSAHIWHS